MPGEKKSSTPAGTEHADLQTAFVLAGLLDGSTPSQQLRQQQQPQQLAQLSEGSRQGMWPPGVGSLNGQMQLAAFALLPQQQQHAAFANANANILGNNSLDAVRASILASQNQQNNFNFQLRPGVVETASGGSTAQDTVDAASALLSSANGAPGTQHYAAAMHWLQHGVGCETRTSSGEAAATKTATEAAAKRGSTQRRRKSGSKGASTKAAAPMLDRKRNSMSMSMDICDSDTGGAGGSAGGDGKSSKQSKKSKAASLGHMLTMQSKRGKPPTPAEVKQQTAQRKQLHQQLQNLQQQQQQQQQQQHRHGADSHKKHSISHKHAADESDDDLVLGPNGQPMSRRERKNTREKQRRLEVNTMFDSLMCMLDLPKDAKADKVKVLQNAIDSIATLREEAAFFRAHAPHAAGVAYAAYRSSQQPQNNSNLKQPFSTYGGGVLPRHDVVVPGPLTQMQQQRQGGCVVPSVGNLLKKHGDGGAQGIISLNDSATTSAAQTNNLSGGGGSGTGVFCQPTSGRRMSVMSGASYSSMDESKSNGGGVTPAEESVGPTYTA